MNVNSQGIPYKGSKRKLANKIVTDIRNCCQTETTFVDLFGGGGAISLAALSQFKHVIYNDAEKYIVALLKAIINNEIPQSLKETFITREMFFDRINNPDNYPDYEVGFAMYIYSFGNNGRTYLYSKEKEPYKCLLHNIILSYGFNKENRLKISKTVKYTSKIYEELQRIQSIESIERIERIQRIQSIERLTIYNHDYKDVIIPENSVVYCDIPYEGTGKYVVERDTNKDNTFHKDFYAWALKQDHKVFVSSYECPLYEVSSYIHNSTLSPTTNNKVIEKLFCNKKIKHMNRLF